MCAGSACVRYARLASRAPGVLLLGQVDGGGLGADGDPVLVQHLNQNLPDVFVVGVKVKDVAHHIGQALIGEFLLGSVRDGTHEEILLRVGPSVAP